MGFKKSYYFLRSYMNIILKDMKLRFPLPFFRKIQLWKRGFLAEKYVLYNLSENSYKNYLSDSHTSMARWINDPFTDILSNKFIFERIVSPFIRVPKTYGLILGGKIFASSLSFGFNEWVDLFTFCTENPVIMKPVVGGGGDGIMLITEKNGTFFINGDAIDKPDLINKLEHLDNYLVSEYVKQGEFPKSLHPATTNTMRIVTLIGDVTNEPFILRAVQRIGNKTSAPYDNFTKGGLSTVINSETGRLGAAATHPHSAELLWHEIHPDTGNPIKGSFVPGWDEIKNQLLWAAKHLPYLKCIGWDILLTDDGLCAIEGNHHPDPDVLQCHGGLLLDEQVRQFYRHHEIIR